MASGGCYCGAVRYEVSGESGGSILCHCLDCRKITGSAYSTNAVYPEDGFKVTKGTPKQHTVKGDSGNEITSNFWYVEILIRYRNVNVANKCPDLFCAAATVARPCGVRVPRLPANASSRYACPKPGGIRPAFANVCKGGNPRRHQDPRQPQDGRRVVCRPQAEVGRHARRRGAEIGHVSGSIRVLVSKRGRRTVVGIRVARNETCNQVGCSNFYSESELSGSFRRSLIICGVICVSVEP
jgi:hypothetical protein